MDNNLTTRDIDGRREVLDPVRRRFVALTPEEWVRQSLIAYLHHSLGYPLELMNVEGAISLNGLSRRCDIVIYNTQLQPVMIVECKKPQVPINQKVLDQASRYNLVLHVPFLLLSNGSQNLILQVDWSRQQLVRLQHIPSWMEMNAPVS